MIARFVNLVVLYCLLGTVFPQRIFFPGNSFPKLQPGVMEIEGYYADGSQVPMILANDISDDKDENAGFPDTESRGLSSTSSDTSRTADSSGQAQSRFLIPTYSSTDTQVPAYSPFSKPFRVTDTVTVTNVQPPLCVACKCLQGGQTCAARGGVQLFTIPVAAAPTALPPGALACNPAVGGTANTTIACIYNAPATLSVCDPSCRDVPWTPLCRSKPSEENCLPLASLPAFCGTDCQNLVVGSTVKCNDAYPTVVSARPTNQCSNTIRKRESSSPVVESSFETGTQSRTGRFFGFQVYRNTVTRTSTISGAVTATYVPSANCLPNNLLNAPSC